MITSHKCEPSTTLYKKDVNEVDQSHPRAIPLTPRMEPKIELL
jgi:hypothetical protein